MSIVLSILQILGILILCVLGVALFLILVVLFAPFSYCIEGDIHETKWAKARVACLFHLIRGRISYEDDLIYGEVVLLWKKTTFCYELSKEKDEEEAEKAGAPKKEKKTSSGNIVDKIKGMISKIRDIYPRIKKIISDEKNKLAVRHLKEELFYLVKILLPKKSKVNASFSTGAPDTTGQLCGFIACFPVMYQNGWALRPDFTKEEAFFEGDFWGKGRFFAFQLVGILLRILFDKNCRRMYTMIDRLMKRIKQKPNQEGK